MKVMVKYLKKFWILSLLFLLTNCQIKIPIKFVPQYSTDDNSPPLIMRNLIHQKIYASFEIGDPKREIQIPLNFDSTDFFIVNYDKVSKNPEEFSNVKYYDSSISSSFTFVEGNYRNGYKFKQATYNKDIFYFNDKKYEIEFYYPLDNISDSGGIGIKLSSNYYGNATVDVERTFFGKLLEKGLAKNYHWTIFFDSKENKIEEEGFILIGCLPDEMDDDLGYYKKEYFESKNAYLMNLFIEKGKLENRIYLEDLYAYKGKDKSSLISDFPVKKKDQFELDLHLIELDYNSGGVRAPTNLKMYYHRVFEEYISQGTCFSSSLYKQNGVFYYCKNNKNVLSKIKSEFPGISLTGPMLRSTFTLDADDLFIEQKGYVFCLLYFSNNLETTWAMGKPFLKKYLFTIDNELRYLSFYSNDFGNEN